MIISPRKSVTRFFIPLIDVLILLFAIFLLMPFVSGPEGAEPTETPIKGESDEPLPTEVKVLQELVNEERRRVKRLEEEKKARLADRLSVRVLEIDPATGVLYYYDPGREEIRTDADAIRLILKQKELARGKDLFFLILYPRRPSAFPTAAQIEHIREWFKNEAFGFDIP